MYTMAGLTLILFAFALYLSSYDTTAGASVALLSVFVLIFEFGPGPICWLYISEVTNEKGVAVATSLIWTTTLIYSTAGLVLNSEVNLIVIAYCLVVPCGLATFFVYYFVKETKGLSEYELLMLYRSD